MIRGLYSGGNDDYIYFERQSGSRLCGLHALNHLMQSHVFTKAALDKIALSLDLRESELSENASKNADSDGFYSITVVELALLNAHIQIRSVASQELQTLRNDPTGTNSGYLCHHNNHFFAVRPVRKRWFLLDSLKTVPIPIESLELQNMFSQILKTYMIYHVTYSNDAKRSLPEPERLKHPDIPFAQCVEEIQPFCYLSFDLASRLSFDNNDMNTSANAYPNKHNVSKKHTWPTSHGHSLNSQSSVIFDEIIVNQNQPESEHQEKIITNSRDTIHFSVQKGSNILLSQSFPKSDAINVLFHALEKKMQQDNLDELPIVITLSARFPTLKLCKIAQTPELFTILQNNEIDVSEKTLGAIFESNQKLFLS